MRYFKKHYLVLIFSLICIGANAQTDNSKIIKLTKDSLVIAKELFSKNRKLGEPIARRVLAVAANYKELKLEYADANNILALYTMYSQRFEESEKFLQNALKIANDIDAKNIINKINSNFINLYLKKGDYQAGLKYALSILPNFENDKIVKANTLANIAVFYNYLGNYNLSVKYQLEAQQIFTEVNNKYALSNGYNVLSVCYQNLGNYEKAREYAIKSVDIKTILSDTLGIINATINLATTLFKLKEYDLVYSYLKKAETICLSYGSNVELSKTYINLAVYYDKINNQKKSLEYNLKSIEIAKSTTDLYVKANAYLNLSKGYSNLGIYDTAYVIRLYADTLLNTLNDINSQKQIAEMQVKYETEKKEFKIVLLNKTDSLKSLAIANQQIAINKNLYDIANQKLALVDAHLKLADDSLQLSMNKETILQNRLDSTQKEERIKDLNKEKQIQALEVNRKNIAIVGLSIFAVMVMLLGYSFYKRRSLQQQATMQAALAQQQQKATIEIINAEEKERKRIAEDLHDGVGQLMTAAWLNLQALKEQTQPNINGQYQLINKTMLLVDESCKEVRQVSHNMMPNALLRKGLVNAVKEFIGQINTGKLSINLQTEELQKALPSHVETILYRVIQESVNNVVKHAEATQLDISINQDADGIDVMIEDNGKGFDTTITRETDGIGLQNIASRTQYLKGTVEWNSSKGNGTLVAIHIPTII